MGIFFLLKCTIILNVTHYKNICILNKSHCFINLQIRSLFVNSSIGKCDQKTIS